MIACCMGDHCDNDDNGNPRSRFSGGFLVLHVGLVTHGVWTLVTGLLRSSRLRSLQINAREMMDPPTSILNMLQAAVSTNTTMDELVLFFPLTRPVATAIFRGLEHNTTLRSFKTLCPQGHGPMTHRVCLESLPRMKGLRQFCVVAPRQPVCRALAQRLLRGIRQNTSLVRFSSPLPDPYMVSQVASVLERNKILYHVVSASSLSSHASSATMVPFEAGILGKYLGKLSSRNAETSATPLYHLVKDHLLHVLASRTPYE